MLTPAARHSACSASSKYLKKFEKCTMPAVSVSENCTRLRRRTSPDTCGPRLSDIGYRISTTGLRIADVRVFRTEEPRQQRIDPQQPVARERQPLRRGLGQIALGAQRREWRGKQVQDVDPVFLGEIRGTKPSELQLQDHLAPHPLVICRAIRAPKRQLAALDRFAVG